MENIQNSPYKDVRPIFNSRYWTTPPYEGIYFNDFIFHGLRPNILDRVIINDMSGSSLHFKRFVSLSLKILDNNVQAELINFEVDVEEGNIEEEENEFSDDSDLDSLSSFIDNEETENDINFYHNLDNVETDIEQTLKDGYDKVWKILKILMKFQICVKVQRMNQKLMNLKLQQKNFSVLAKLYYQKLTLMWKLNIIIL